MDCIIWKNIINSLRDERNLTQEEFAEICGVSRTTVQNWETKGSLPHIKTCKLIIKKLKLERAQYPELFEYVSPKRAKKAADESPIDGKKPLVDVTEGTDIDNTVTIVDGISEIAAAAEAECEVSSAVGTESATCTALIYSSIFLPVAAGAEEKSGPTEQTHKKPKEPAVARLHKKWKALHPLCKAIISAFCVWFTVWFVIALILIGACVFPAQTKSIGRPLAQATFVSIDWDELIFLLIVSLLAVTVLSVIIYLIIRQIRRIKER